jgi:hypothetical protein
MSYEGFEPKISVEDVIPQEPPLLNEKFLIEVEITETKELNKTTPSIPQRQIKNLLSVETPQKLNNTTSSPPLDGTPIRREDSQEPKKSKPPLRSMNHSVSSKLAPMLDDPMAQKISPEKTWPLTNVKKMPGKETPRLNSKLSVIQKSKSKS